MEMWVAIVGLVSAVAVALITRFPTQPRDDRLRDSIARDLELLKQLSDGDVRSQYEADVRGRLTQLHELRAARTSVAEALLRISFSMFAAGWFLWLAILLMSGELPAARTSLVSVLLPLAVLGLGLGTLLAVGVYMWQAAVGTRRIARWLSARFGTAGSTRPEH